MPRKKIPLLAAALAEMAQTEGTLESRADSVLSLVKSGGIRDGAAFNKAVREAYKANNWHSIVGRPGRGNRGTPVPQTVKSYVSIVRAAFRLDLVVAHFKTFHALRKGVKAARVARQPRPVARDPRLAGLTLVKHDTLTGAPFHDLAVLYEKSSRQQRSRLLAEVNRLVREYRPAVAPVLTLQKAA